MDGPTSTASTDVDDSLQTARPTWLSSWPLALYFGVCLMLAYNQHFVMEFTHHVDTQFNIGQQLFSGVQFGQSMGVGCVLALIAGLCGQNVIRSLGVASLIAAAIFLTLMSGLMGAYSEYSELFYVYNLPLMIFGAAIPLFIARMVSGTVLSRRATIVTTRRFRIDHLLQITAVIACLIIFCRVPVQLHQLTYVQLSVYLPGLVLISALASLVTVLPSIRWVFQAKTTWKSWLLLAATSSLGIAMLCGSFGLLLGNWMGGAVFRVVGTGTAILFFLPLYASGVAALRANGFRWVRPAVASEAALEPLRQASPESRTGWLWMAGFLLVALTTGLPLSLLKWNERMRYERGMQWLAEIRAAGGDAHWSTRYVSRVKLPPTNSDYWLERLKELPGLFHLNLDDTDIGDAQVEQLVRNHSMLDSISLAGTNITDQALEHLASAKYLRSVDLSRTNVSSAAIAQLLSPLKSTVVVAALEDLGLEDEDFMKIYTPRIQDWKLAGNQLTEKSLLPVFQNGPQSLDISRNAGSERIFLHPQIQASPASVKLDGLNVGDAEITQWLATAPPERVTLGKTSITPTGLRKLLSTCWSIEFLEGSFDESTLAQLAPTIVPMHIAFRGQSFTGDFLHQWDVLPSRLGASYSSFSDTQLARLAENSNWKPDSITLKDCPITDASLPLLERLQPQLIDLSGTHITASGLLRCALPNARAIWIAPGQFTGEEVQQLKQKHAIVVASDYGQW